MSNELTPARQANAVSEGIAFGLALLGVSEVSGSKMAVDFSVHGALRSWPQQSLFPAVMSKLTRNHDGMFTLVHADRNRHVVAFYWESNYGSVHRIIARQPDWDPTDEDEISWAEGAIADGLVAAADWTALAQDLLNRLQR